MEMLILEMYLEFGEEMLIKGEMIVILLANINYIKLVYVAMIILNIYLLYNSK